MKTIPNTPNTTDIPVPMVPATEPPLSPASATTIRQPSYIPGATTNIYAQARGLMGLEAPTGEVVGAAFEDTMTRNPTPSYLRLVDREHREGNYPTTSYPEGLSPLIHTPLPSVVPEKLSPEAATAKYGVEMDGKKVLTFDHPVTEATAKELQDLKRAEVGRQIIMSRATGGAVENVAKFGVTLGGSIIDPLNIASAFVPVMGEARYAAMLARAGGAVGRAGVRVGVGALEGAAGAALLEPLVYGGAKSEQADYDLYDSFLNVTVGGVLGGGLHAGAGAIGDRLGISAYARDLSDRKAAALDAGHADFEPIIPEGGERSGPPNRFESDMNGVPLEMRQTLTRSAVSELVTDGEIRATGELSVRSGVGEPLRGEPGWRFTEADVEALRDVNPDVVQRAEAAATRAQETEGMRSQAETLAITEVDEKAGQRLQAIGEELSAPSLASDQRIALQAERDALVSEAGPKLIADTERNYSTDAAPHDRASGVARQEARAASRDLNDALAQMKGERRHSLTPEDLQAIDAAAKRADVKEPEAPVRPVEKADAAEAEKESAIMDELVNSMETISPMDAAQREALDAADERVRQVSAETKAYDIAFACALRGA